MLTFYTIIAVVENLMRIQNVEFALWHGGCDI